MELPIEYYFINIFESLELWNNEFFIFRLYGYYNNIRLKL